LEQSRFGAINKSIIRMGGVYAATKIASDKKICAMSGRWAFARIVRRRRGQQATMLTLYIKSFAKILFSLRGLTLLE